MQLSHGLWNIVWCNRACKVVVTCTSLYSNDGRLCVENAGPEPEPGIQNESAVQNAVLLWSCVAAGTVDPSPTDFTVEMMNIAPFGLLNQLNSQLQLKDWQQMIVC